MPLPPTFWNAAGALSVLAALFAPLSPLVILPSPSAAAAQRPPIFGAGEFPAVFSPIVDNGPGCLFSRLRGARLGGGEDFPKFEYARRGNRDGHLHDCPPLIHIPRALSPWGWEEWRLFCLSGVPLWRCAFLDLAYCCPAASWAWRSSRSLSPN